jgi:membrane protein YdbS with pleckstrin-like domain
MEVGIIQRGIGLTRDTWWLVRAQPALLILPTVALALQALVVAIVVGPLWFDLIDHHSRMHIFVGAAICAYPPSFISTFCNVAYYAQVDAAFRGAPIGVREGLERASTRLGAIAAWSLLDTAVGLALRAVEKLPYAGTTVAGRTATWIRDAAWSLASFFVVPALALEDRNVRGSLRRSATAIRERWGEAVTGDLAIGGAGLVVLIPVIVVGVIGYRERSGDPVIGYGMLAVAGAALAVVMIVQSTVTEAFRVAVFRYATAAEPAGPFVESQLVAAFRPRDRRRLI